MNQENKVVAALCCTHGRYTCLQRSIRMFLDQDYEGNSLMFIANSGTPLFGWEGGYVIFDVSKQESKESEECLFLTEIERQYQDGHLVSKSKPKEYPNKRIVIWNMPENCYSSVGEKYNLALNYMLTQMSNNWRDKIDIVTSWDDDDIFLPNHLSSGVLGMETARAKDCLAYKPRKSYYRYRDGEEVKVSLVENTLEPSIFVDVNYLKDTGYANVSIKYHQQWLDPLIAQNKIFVDNSGTPTLVYNWGDNLPIYKMSGRGIDNQMNFELHKKNQLDFGTSVIKPIPSAQVYYDEVKTLANS